MYTSLKLESNPVSQWFSGAAELWELNVMAVVKPRIGKSARIPIPELARLSKRGSS